MNSMDELPAFPEGWYFVASRESILREKLIEKKWLGEEIVVWCDEAGRVCVADAVCPHLGSHLGPEVGGQVCNGRLVCPFHGFEFDATGQCVATPNAPAPKAAKLKVYETREILGLVFAWWEAVGSRRSGICQSSYRPVQIGVKCDSIPFDSEAIPRKQQRTPWTLGTCATCTVMTTCNRSVRYRLTVPI